MSMHKGAYDGDGRTTVTILNKDPEYGLMIDGVSCVSVIYYKYFYYTLSNVLK